MQERGAIFSGAPQAVREAAFSFTLPVATPPIASDLEGARLSG